MADGDRLASVTWLFGERDAPTEQAVSPNPSARVSRSRVDEVVQSDRSVAPDSVPTNSVPTGSAPLDESIVSDESVRADRAMRAEKPTRADRASHAGEFQRINNVSMHALARRGMSVAEMRDYLVGREFPQHEADEECDRLLGVGLLDDFALAETLIRTLRQRKGLGRSGVTAELRRRKLENDAIEAALEDLDDDELARAIDLAERRAPQLRSLDAETAKRRLSGFLMRKGYSGGIVRAAVDRALSHTSNGASGPVFR